MSEEFKRLKRIAESRLMPSFIRKNGGLYYSDEIEHVSPDKIKFILNNKWKDITIDGEYPNLEYIDGACRINENASTPVLTEIGGDCTIHENASVPDLAEVGGRCEIYENTSVPVLTKVEGHCHIHENASVPVLAEVGGRCEIYENTSVPVLTKVGGNCDIHENASAPVLAEVGGNCDIYENASAPVLTKVGRDCYIYENASAPVLAEVGGNCEIHENAFVPVLTKVEGHCHIYENASAPALTEVGGNCDIHENASAPVLTEVGRNCEIHENAFVPALTEVGGECIIRENASAPVLTKVGWNCIIFENASVSKLTEVGGYCTICENASVPSLEEVINGCNFEYTTLENIENSVTQYFRSLMNGKKVEMNPEHAELIKSYKDNPPILLNCLSSNYKAVIENLLEIQRNPDKVIELRLEEQAKFISRKKMEFGALLNVKKELWSCPPYEVTDVKFSTPPYAEGKPLSECPGWQGMEASFGHIDSISIKNGNGTVKTISGTAIDAENRIVFEQEDQTVKYGIKDGKVEYIPHPKKDESQDLQQTMDEDLSQSEVRGPRIR